MGNSVIRSDGTVIWTAAWLNEPSSTEEGMDDIFSAYRAWYESQLREDNEDDGIPLQCAS